MAADELYDVIVVGGGPGGAAAAYYLGQAGKRVLVLEKEIFPRYKACGGATSIKLLGEFPFAFDPVIESCVSAVTYSFGGQAVTFELPAQPIRMTMRADLDEFLLKHARAEVRQGDAVESVAETAQQVRVKTRQGKDYAARYLVGADGPNSAVARAVGLRKEKILLGAIEVEAPVPPEILHQYKDRPAFFFGEIDMGYLWIFPKADHLSVGVGALHPRPGELQAALRRVMERCHIPLQGLPLHGHPVPIYTRRERLSTPRVLLVGDAAGLVDPLSGEGIRHAVHSGRIAAQAILSGRIQQYDDEIYRQIGAGHRAMWAVSKFVYRHPAASFNLAVRNPFARQAFVDFLSERSGPGQFALRLAGSILMFIITDSLRKLAAIFSKETK